MVPGAVFALRATNFIAARRCATIPKAISLSSRHCWRRAVSTCCCRPMSRDFCSRACRSGLRARSRSLRRRSTAIARRTARPASAGCLSELGLPQPATAIVTSESELRAAVRFPAVIKTSIGTASRGVWFVRDAREFDEAVRELVAADAFADEVLVQDYRRRHDREGAVGILSRRAGRLPCLSAGSRWASAAARRSRRASTGRRSARCWRGSDERLAWHGALSIDYLMPEQNPTPLLIDCNPRLVDPMSAYLAGTDLVGLLLRVSRGETPAAIAGKPRGRPHASRDAGAARHCRARGLAARRPARMLASLARQRRLRRQPRGDDARAVRTGSARCRWR